MAFIQDLEAGDTQQSEKSFLLADRRTSSLDEAPNDSMSRAHSRSPPPSKPKGSLQVANDSSAPDQQSTEQAKRLKGLGLAGVATVFQAVMSVCAKILGNTFAKHVTTVCAMTPKLHVAYCGKVTIPYDYLLCLFALHFAAGTIQCLHGRM